MNRNLALAIVGIAFLFVITPCSHADGRYKATLSNLKSQGDLPVGGPQYSAWRSLGSPTPEEVELLKQGLNDDASAVRIFAITMLGDSSQESRNHIESFVALMRDKNEEVRWAAAQALGRPWLHAADDPVCFEALRQALNDSYPRVRRAAAEALGFSLQSGAKAAPLLIAALKDRDENVRQAALHSLGTAKPLSPEARAVLQTHGLESGDWRKKQNVAYHLALQNRESPEGPLILAAELSAPNPEARANAGLLLGGVGESAKSAVPALIAALKDDSEGVRRQAAYALGNIGEGSRDVAAALAEGLKDSSAEVRNTSLSSLSQLFFDSNYATYDSNALKRVYESSRIELAHTLSEMPEKRPLQIQALTVLSKDPSPRVRDAAVDALRIVNERK